MPMQIAISDRLQTAQIQPLLASAQPALPAKIHMIKDKSIMSNTPRRQRYRRNNIPIMFICIALSLFFIGGTKHQSTLAFSPPFSPATGTHKRSTITKTSLGVASSISAATGEADRAFRLGLQLEKAGLARAASAAFHEAATLYQCFLDFSTLTDGSAADVVAGSDDEEASGAESGPMNIFQHVTSLATDDDENSSPTVQAALAYACIRLGHLSHDAFGDSRASKRLYKLASSIDPHPSGVTYHGIGNSRESSIAYGLGRDGDESSVWREEMEKAVKAYREASKLGGGGVGGNGEVLFHLAVALEVGCYVCISLIAEEINCICCVLFAN